MSTGESAPPNEISLLAAVFFTSMTMMILEVTLTRLFSVILYYHYVFAVVSVAVLGLSGGAVLIARLRISSWSARVLGNGLAVCSLIVSVFILLSVLLVVVLPSARLLLLYVVVAFFPFFFVGAILAACFVRFSSRSGRIYFADLTGAAFGALAVVFSLEKLGGYGTAVFLVLVPCLSALLFASGKLWRILSFSALGLALLVGLANSKYGLVRLHHPDRFHYTKTMFAELSGSESERRVIDTSWNALGRVDVVESGDPRQKLIYTDSGAGTPMVEFDGDLRTIEYLRKEIGYFPFRWGKRDKVLIIGPGGGKDALLAFLGGSRKIVGVEVNPGIIRAMNKFAAFNGGIYAGYKGIEIVRDEGRRFIEATKEAYDIIYLSLVYVQAADQQGLSLTENYVFTREAFSSYLRLLASDGRLVIIFHDINDLTKGFITALFALQDAGRDVREAAEHVLVLNGSDKREISSPLLIVQKRSFTPEEARDIEARARSLGFRPLYVPFRSAGMFYSLVVRGRQSLEEFISFTGARVSPATDNSPFFYQFDRRLPVELQAVLFPVSVLLVGSIVWLCARERKKSDGARGERYFLPFYFPLLGVGYMLVEVVLVQKLLLLLGYPSLLFSVVLFSLLLSGGAGSLLSDSLFKHGKRRILVLLTAIIVLLVLLYIPLLGMVIERAIGLSLLYRALVVVGLVSPLGFCMGMPFPVGLRILSAYNSSRVPSAYALNGIASVLGSVLAVVVALVVGFVQVLLIGAGAYLFAALLLWRSVRTEA